MLMNLLRFAHTAPLVVALLVTCIVSVGAHALTLRLDVELQQREAGATHATTEQLIRFGTSDLRRRSGMYRHEARSVQRENLILASRISGDEELIARMTDLSGVQEHALGVLQSTLVWQRAAGMPAQAAPFVPMLSAQSPAVPPATLSVAGVGLAYWLPGALAGALVSALLGWLWVSLAARRKRHSSTNTSSEDARVAGVSRNDERADAAVLYAQRKGKDVVGGGLRDSALAGATKPPCASGPDGAVTAKSATGTVAAAALATDAVASAVAAADAKAGPAIDAVAGERTGKAVDRHALKEVDILIAFEQFDKAKVLLDQMMSRDPDNPEYTLRNYHIRTHGGADTTTDDVELLRAMMEGPMSDTVYRVREIGRGLMPGDPLFVDPSPRDEAGRQLKGAGKDAGKGAGKAPVLAATDSNEFAKTVVLKAATLVPMDAAATR